MDNNNMQIQFFEQFDCVSSDHIPVSYAVNKTDYIRSRKEIIRKMKSEIKEIKKFLGTISNKNSNIYKATKKRLERCYEILGNCEYSIKLTEKQLEIEQRPRIR